MLQFTLTPLAQRHATDKRLSEFDLFGFLPGMALDNDPRPVIEQFKERYVGGFRPLEGFALLNLATTQPILKYPGDPPMRAIGTATHGEERIILFEGSWVAIVQPDNRYVVSRMD